jgi:hypothetical protein
MPIVFPKQGDALICSAPICIHETPIEFDKAYGIIQLSKEGTPELQVLCLDAAIAVKRQGIPIEMLKVMAQRATESEEYELRLIEQKEAQKKAAAKAIEDAAKLEEYLKTTLFACVFPGCDSEPQPAEKMENIVFSIGEAKHPVCVKHGAMAKARELRVFNLASTILHSAGMAQEKMEKERGERIAREKQEQEQAFFKQYQPVLPYDRGQQGSRAPFARPRVTSATQEKDKKEESDRK